MQEGKAAKERFAQDKPKDCACCYFWSAGKKACTKKSCYYLLPEQKAEEKKGDCESCPYGKHSPCIGYCLAKILWEMKESHGK